jgi:Helix-turn-helix domain
MDLPVQLFVGGHRFGVDCGALAPVRVVARGLDERHLDAEGPHLGRSVELLAEGHSVTTIALDLGYSSISAFIALFKRAFGLTPTQYLRDI